MTLIKIKGIIFAAAHIVEGNKTLCDKDLDGRTFIGDYNNVTCIKCRNMWDRALKGR